MKKIILALMSVTLIVTATSCGTTSTIKNDTTVAGYTLKNKKELMAQKIANKKPKTFLVTP